MTSIAEDHKGQSPPPPHIIPAQPLKAISQGMVFNVLFVSQPAAVTGQESIQKSNAGKTLGL